MKRSILESFDENDENVGNTWDGDAKTFWKPPLNDDRKYSFVIFLGDLFVVEVSAYISNYMLGMTEKVKFLVI